MKSTLPVALISAAFEAGISTIRADSFGSGANIFTVDFVNIGNPGNADDSGRNRTYGGVKYGYRIGRYEVSREELDKARASGLANVGSRYWTGLQPAVLSWLEAAAFVNWLNTSASSRLS